MWLNIWRGILRSVSEGGVWLFVRYCAHMRDRSHFLITHDCGRAMDTHVYQKLFQSIIIWENDIGLNRTSPSFPYKKEWKEEETVQSFLYGKKGGAGTSHGAFHQIMSDRFSFWNPRTWSVFLTKCITQIWIHSLSWVGRTENSHYPSLSWASQYLPSYLMTRLLE